MVTPLEHLTYDTDGMVLVTVRGDRNLSRERENIFDKRGRFIDAPEAGGEIKIDKKMQSTALYLFCSNKTA